MRSLLLAIAVCLMSPVRADSLPFPLNLASDAMIAGQSLIDENGAEDEPVTLQPIKTDFRLAFRNGNLAYALFVPSDSTLPKFEITLLGDREISISGDTVHIRSAKNNAVMGDEMVYHLVDTVRTLNEIGTSSALVSRNGDVCEFRREPFLDPKFQRMTPVRIAQAKVQADGRITSATFSFQQTQEMGSPTPAFVITASYTDETTLPITIEKKMLNPEFAPQQCWWLIKEIETDPTILSEAVRPTLLVAGMACTDHRFTPPLHFELTEPKLPTDDELFGIAAKRKAEEQAQEKKRNESATIRAATVDNPRNIKDVPLTKESWGKRLRTVPNWVYGGAIVLVFFGWIVSKGRKN